MKFLDKYVQRKIDEFEQHPERNKDSKFNIDNYKFYILLFLIAILILLYHYDLNHPEINIFPIRH